MYNLKKVILSYESIKKVFNFYDDYNDNIRSMLETYTDYLIDRIPKINWFAELMGDEVEEKHKVDLFNVETSSNKITIKVAIPYIRTYYDPEIYNSYKELIDNYRELKGVEEIKQLKKNDIYSEDDDYEVFRDKEGKYNYIFIDNDTIYKYFYIDIEADWETGYFVIGDVKYKSLYNAHAMAMLMVETYKKNALDSELVFYENNIKNEETSFDSLKKFFN